MDIVCFCHRPLLGLRQFSRGQKVFQFGRTVTQLVVLRQRRQCDVHDGDGSSSNKWECYVSNYFSDEMHHWEFGSDTIKYNRILIGYNLLLRNDLIHVVFSFFYSYSHVTNTGHHELYFNITCYANSLALFQLPRLLAGENGSREL